MMMKRRKLTVQQRRSFALSMRDAGLTYEQIADEAIKKFGAKNLPKGYSKRLACLDIKRELNSSSSKKLNIALRYEKIAGYRLAGLTYQQILRKLKEELGEHNLPHDYTERHVCRDLKRYMDKMKADHQQGLLDAKDLYRQRLNFLLNKLWHKAAENDYQAIDRSLRIMGTLAKLDGLDDNAAQSAASLPEHQKFKSIADITEYYTQADQKGQKDENNES
jgi:hypothetical protein